MFLRKNRFRFDGEVYDYWTLCGTVRTGRDPRRRVVASPGKLTEEGIEAGWGNREALLEGRRTGPGQRLQTCGRERTDSSHKPLITRKAS